MAFTSKTKAFQPLYKRTSGGGTQVWNISVIPVGPGNDEIGVIKISYGLLGGKMQESEEEIRKGKNVGKKNATTPFQQACAEAQSRWEIKQSRKGYGLTVEESAATRAISPMLAHVYEKHKKKVDWDTAFAQPKFDGFRCLAHISETGKVELRSRENQPMPALDHIRNALRLVKPIDHGSEGFILDGELYCHGMSLNQISSACKKKTAETAKINYHVYDAAIDATFEERAKLVSDFLSEIGHSSLHTVRTVKVRTESELMLCQSEFMNEGYEGAMLRHGRGAYEAGKRSSALLKVKTFVDDEFKVIDFKMGRGKYEGVPVFVCQTEDGHPFDVTAPGDMLTKVATGEVASACVGKLLTVKYIYFTKTNTPVPFLPVAKRFVDDDVTEMIEARVPKAEE